MTWTSLKLIQWTAGYFEQKGIPNPRLDAELLLAHVLKCPRIDLYTAHDKKVGEKDLAKYRELIERRAKREPLQYIIGETEFWGLKIQVTPDVLIPRPETELLVEEALRLLGDSERRKVPFRSERYDREVTDGGHGGRAGSPPAIIEIGTGSGCIAVALAKQLPEAEIIATESSKEAAEVARQNLENHGVGKQVKIILADLAPWRVFEAEERRFDLIISNPPYIPTGDFPNLQPEVRDFEPRKALDGGPDGLSVIRRILEEAPPYLRPGGFLLLEIGEGQASLLQKELTQHPSSLRLRAVKKDLAEVERIAILTNLSK